MPLSSVILIGEIFLCLASVAPPLAGLLGTLLEGLIRFLNQYVERLDGVSFSVWNGFSLSVVQVLLLFACAGTIGYWLLEKSRPALLLALAAFLLFMLLRTRSLLEANGQQKLIVYNIPKYRAIDVINGRQAFFLGDTVLLQNAFLRNFHLQPSRILHRLGEVYPAGTNSFRFCNLSVYVIDSSFTSPPAAAVPADLLILSKNPRLYIRNLLRYVAPRQIVLDSSVPYGKARLWKRECDSLRIPVYDVREKGAFVMNL